MPHLYESFFDYCTLLFIHTIYYLLLPVRYWKVYTEGTKPVKCVYLKPRGKVLCYLTYGSKMSAPNVCISSYLPMLIGQSNGLHKNSMGACII